MELCKWSYGVGIWSSLLALGLTNLVLPGKGIFESFFARRGTDVGMDLTTDSDERDWDRTYVSPLPRFTLATYGLERSVMRFIHESLARMIGATPSHVLTLINWLIAAFYLGIDTVNKIRNTTPSLPCNRSIVLLETCTFFFKLTHPFWS